ncbi:MAG: SMP-30/gluconolactonase/LRE family protein, partial [Saprospiraceae bacterium]|nr:SMP-30/gluconolactonase/LRE family protein [Saprospiraceae bacterium]
AMVFNADGKKLGLIRVDGPTSNCSLTPDGKTLYITNDGYVLRLIMKK